MNYLEQFLGESSDKHEQDLVEHKDGWLEHKASMEQRLEYLEGMAGDSADKHTGSASELAMMRDVICNTVTSEHHETIIKRMEIMEQKHVELVESHKSLVESHTNIVEEKKVLEQKNVSLTENV